MAFTTNAPIFPQGLANFEVKFVQGTDAAGTYKVGYTADTNGDTIQGMTVVNGDTATAHNVVVAIVNGGGTIVLNTTSITANAGFNGTTPPISLQSLTNWPGSIVDGNSNPGFYIASGDTLEITYGTSLALAGSTLSVFGQVQKW